VARLLVAVGIALLGGAQAGTAGAWRDELQGQPGNLAAGGELGFYLWHDDSGHHLRTTGPGDRHVFRAEFHTAGRFEQVSLMQVEGDDFVAVGPLRHNMLVRFETWSGIDGVDFRIDGGPGYSVELYVDDELIDPGQIFIGANGTHPSGNPYQESR
jgi:hypothetical protein